MLGMGRPMGMRLDRWPAAACRMGMRVDEPIPTLTLPLQGREFDVEGIKGHLRATLPEYMVPVIFVPLEALPLSPNGKLDRKALPAPEMRLALASPRVYEPPQNETETRLAEIWQEILQVEAIGRNDDFFALGGHSLLAARVVARIRQQWACEFALRTLFLKLKDSSSCTYK